MAATLRWEMNVERFFQLMTIKQFTMPLVVNIETETTHPAFGNNYTADRLNIPNSSSSCLLTL
jgi:hypothetical protein